MTKILLAGDSTVTEQPWPLDDPGLCYCGWGQTLKWLLRPGTALQNFAVSGYTVEMFRDEGKYEALRNQLAPGDFVLFQFGHNDQKRPHLLAPLGFRAQLIDYIRQVREASGIPVLVTPVARNSWRGDTGDYNDLLAGYAEAVIRIGSDLDVAVIDLHAASVAWIKSLGLHGAKQYFYPGDYTHPNIYGGAVWAQLIACDVLANVHPDAKKLSALLLPEAQWPPLQAPRAITPHGWTAAPATRCTFAPYCSSGEMLTHAQALDIAMQGYGYFATNEGFETLPDVLRAAMQNGYLPILFPREPEKLDAPISASLFENLMILACQGRNVVSDAARSLRSARDDRGMITQRDAAAYARLLEAETTGSKASADPSDDRPAGS